MPTQSKKRGAPQLKTRQLADKTVHQTFETIEVARSGARQAGNLFDKVFGFGLKPAPTKELPSTVVHPKQSRAVLGELISDLFGATFCALWRLGR